MAAPQIAIDVDPDTGVWRTDGLEMLYMPRHFFLNLLAEVEGAQGRDDFARRLYDSGHRSAYQWCAHQAGVTGLAGLAVFHHYLTRLSQRGWGRFDGAGIDATGGEVRVRQSCFVLGAEGGPPGRRCHLFAGWFPGALQWVADAEDRAVRYSGREVACAAEGHDACRFRIAAA